MRRPTPRTRLCRLCYADLLCHAVIILIFHYADIIFAHFSYRRRSRTRYRLCDIRCRCFTRSTFYCRFTVVSLSSAHMPCHITLSPAPRLPPFRCSFPLPGCLYSSFRLNFAFFRLRHLFRVVLTVMICDAELSVVMLAYISCFDDEPPAHRPADVAAA